MLTISVNELCGETHHTEDKGQPPSAAADVLLLIPTQSDQNIVA